MGLCAALVPYDHNWPRNRLGRNPYESIHIEVSRVYRVQESN